MGEYLSNKCAEVVVLHPAIADAGESDLERINPFSFYEFASKLHAVSALSGEVSTRAGFWPIWQARSAMETLIKGDPIPIGISNGKAQTLRERLDNVMKDRFETTDQKGEKRLRFPEESDQPIAGYVIDWIKSGISEFETVFAEEMRETATYFVPRRGIYWTPALVDSADETFPRELLSFIPHKAREDWKSAGRCLAFNLLSASGFHVARAVEACLESYYGLFSGKPGETLHSWYDYIKALREIAAKEPTPCPLAKTLIELDQMREDYRNPIVHPRVVLSEGDARMLFANGESLIIAMAQEIALAATGIQPALALVGGKEAGGEAS